jgi:hypothetical protein
MTVVYDDQDTGAVPFGAIMLEETTFNNQKVRTAAIWSKFLMVTGTLGPGVANAADATPPKEQQNGDTPSRRGAQKQSGKLKTSGRRSSAKKASIGAPSSANQHRKRRQKAASMKGKQRRVPFLDVGEEHGFFLHHHPQGVSKRVSGQASIRTVCFLVVATMTMSSKVFREDHIMLSG